MPKPNAKPENFFGSIPLAIYTTKYKELDDERKKLINTINNKVSLGYLSPIPLAELYICSANAFLIVNPILFLIYLPLIHSEFYNANYYHLP